MVDFGLPVSSEIAASNDPQGPRPFIGSLGDHAYYLARTSAPTESRWWLVGIDVRNGQRLFPAVELSSAAMSPQCFLNGPTDVLCLSRNSLSATAWVVDADSGATTYTGPTDLRAIPGGLVVQQVGSRALAAAGRQGVYGIGHRAETTWFVPGTGTIAASPPAGSDSMLAAQALPEGERDVTIFSIDGGEVIVPDVATGARMERTVLYPGGFAAAVEVDGKDTGVQFFDTSGSHVGGGVDGTPTTDQTGTLPIVSGFAGGASSVFSASGRKLLDMPRGVKYLVGSTMLLNENSSDEFSMWRQYDLKTGVKGNACDFNMGNFLGTDGSVFVFAVTNRKADVILKARDSNTCDTLWTLPSAVDSLARAWRIDTTLVQLSDDGTELMSLVAPS
ncbi:hypothetical protein [Mycolicibacterium sp.]|uniref:hypothetical protein n=1 Tax=Mycolicibacterium sp. TaxID=2320850 RepID=UPI001A209864|nr:hypothetical protein [Mycolicibacterium sp.]MBJ7341935.1 hypothetical protein [Mycolicibacterium sp.]